jgi:hypothetical protein
MENGSQLPWLAGYRIKNPFSKQHLQVKKEDAEPLPLFFVQWIFPMSAGPGVALPREQLSLDRGFLCVVSVFVLIKHGAFFLSRRT